MSYKTTLVLIVLAALLGGVYALLPGASGEGDRFSPFVFDERFDAGRITSLTVKREAVTLTLERKDDGSWVVVRPYAIGAEDRKVRSILEALSRLNLSKVYLSAVDASKHGIDQPRFAITVNQQLQSWSVRFGGPLPMSDNVVARPDDGGQPFAVPERLVNQLDVSMMDVADLRVVPVDPTRLKQLKLHTPQGSFGLTIENNRYVLEDPEPRRASQAAAGKLVDELAQARMVELIYKSFVPKNTGLDDPVARLEIENRDNTAYTVNIGLPVTDEGQLFYASRPDLGVLFMVRRSFIDLLRRPADVYRARRLMDLDPMQISRLTLADDRRSVTLVRRDNSWAIERGKTFHPVDFAAVETLMHVVTTTPIHGYTAERTTNLAHFGLDRPQRRIEIVPTEGAAPYESLTVLLGKTTGGGRRIYARRTDEPAVLELDADLLKVLTPSELAWRSRVVFNTLATDIRRIEVDRGEGPATVVVRTDTGWRFDDAAGAEAELDTWKAEELVVALKRVKAERFVTATVTEEKLKSYGLDNPLLRVSFTVSRPGAEATVRTLAVGAVDPAAKTHHFAHFQHDPLVFTITRELLETLGAKLEK